MSSVPAGKRRWNCPDCGSEVLLSITQLDPMACPECLAKLKGNSAVKKSEAGAAGSVGSAVSSLQALPEIAKLAGVGLVALVLGLLIGFVAGRVTALEPVVSRDSSPTRSNSTRSADREEERDAQADAPDESTRPGPGYKWVKGYTRKDGVKVKGHWARDPNYRK